MSHLYCWKIPAGKKTELLEQLTWLGVTRRSVYPDLLGIAKSLDEGEALFQGARRKT